MTKPEPQVGAAPRGGVGPREHRGTLVPMERAFWLWPIVWPKLRLPRGGSVGALIGRAAFALLGLAIAVAIHAGAAWFLRLVYGVEVIGPLLLQRLLDMVLMVLFSVLLLSNIVTSLASFFLAKDLELLMVAPMPPRALFGARFYEQLVQSSWMVLVFGLAVLLAFVRVAGTTWSYLLLPLVLLPLLVIAAAIATTLTQFLVSSLPAARLRDVLAALLFVAFIVLYILARVMEPERFLNPEGFASMVSFLASFSSPTGAYLPPRWATEALASSFRGAHLGATALYLPLALLWSAAGASQAIAGLLFRWLHRSAYSRSQQGAKVGKLSRVWGRLRGEAAPVEGTLPSPGRVGARADGLRFVGRLTPAGPLREFLIKDLKLLLRDASQWSQLVLLLALVFVYLYNFRHFRTLGDSGLVGPFALFLFGLALSGFVTTAVSVRFAYPLISVEGRMLWLLCTAPMPRQRILHAKLLSTLAPLVLVAVVMSVVSSLILGLGPQMVLLGASAAFCTALVVASVAVGVGAVVPNYRADNAAKVAASFGGLVCMSSAMLAALAVLAWVIYPAWWIHRGHLDHFWGFFGCAFGALATTAGISWAALWLGGRALQRFEP